MEDDTRGRTRQISNILSRRLGSRQCAQCTLIPWTPGSPARLEECGRG